MKNIKAIFFDLDNTLIDSDKAEHNACIEFKKMFKEFDDIDDNEFAKLWHKIAAQQYERYSKGEITFNRQRIDRVKKVFLKADIVKEDEEAKEIFKKYLKLYEKNWQVFDDTVEVLEKLKNKYKLGIITNGDGIQQRQKMENTRLNNYFSEIIISSEVGASKPKKEIFEIACKKIKEDPKNCLMIGDIYKLDIEGAVNTGLNAIWINRKNKEIEFKNQIKELKELLINYNL